VHDVHLASRHVCALANGQWPILPAHSDDQRSGQDLHTFVLTSVDVPGNPATGIETYFDLEKFSACVLAALQERQVLARESVVEMLIRGHGTQSCLGEPARKRSRRRAYPDRSIGVVPGSNSSARLSVSDRHRAPICERPSGSSGAVNITAAEGRARSRVTRRRHPLDCLGRHAHDDNADACEVSDAACRE
jgi:hypothetical protein